MTLFVLIALTHFVALISPGADFFLILTTLLGSGSKHARRVCFGIVTGNGLILMVIYMCMLRFGEIHPVIFSIIQFLGVMYLLYLAFSFFRAANHQNNSDENTALQLTKPAGLGQAFLHGLSSSLLNPKNWMFYSSLLVMIYTVFSVWQHVAVVIWMLLMVLGWNLFLIQIFQQPAWLERLSRYKYKIYAFASLCFFSIAVMGIWMLFTTIF